jgi:hypothetical protein
VDHARYAADVMEAQGLIARYWAIVDGKLDAPVGPCFTETCFFRIEGMEINGREMVESSVRARTAKAVEQDRSTRHLISNLHAAEYSGEHLVLDSLITVFSGYGAAPALLSAPSSLGDFRYRCEKSGGEWKIARLEATIIFAGSDSPFFKPPAKG